jgi:hypothetical protein
MHARQAKPKVDLIAAMPKEHLERFKGALCLP